MQDCRAGGQGLDVAVTPPAPLLAQRPQQFFVRQVLQHELQPLQVRQE